MIPNITHSTGSGKYLGYDLGDKDDQYQKVQFLAAEGVMLDDRLIDRLNQNWEDGDEKGHQAFRKVAMRIANDLDKQYLAQASLNGRPKIKAINVSLSYSPVDTDKVNEVVYDETRDDYVPLRLKMGREFLDGMGFGDIQYVAVSHLGTHCAHDHYAINTVRADGSTIKLNFDFVRAQKIAEEIRQKYGLTPPDESLQMITPKAREAMKQSCSWEEYEQRLQEHGISLVFSDHSKNGRGYGVSYSFGKKVIPGSKLHRSLSYGQVEATLARNLANRVAVESQLATQQEQAKATELRNAYPQMVPTIQGLDRAVRNTFQLYADTKATGIAISAQTTQKYNELKRSWSEFRQLNQERKEATTKGALIKSIGGIMMSLNPIVGILAILIGKIATDIRLSAIQYEKNALLNKIEGLKSDIDSLQQQKAQIKIEKQERLNDYLQAKDARNEFRQGMNTVKEEIDAIKRGIQIDELKHRFPFRAPGHIQYIVHSQTDASIFHAGHEELTEDKIETARLMLKDKGYMVASDRGPDGYDGFYQSLLRKQEYENYRVGNMYIHADGKISFGPEKIFGDAQKTAPAFAREIIERPQLAQVSEKKPVQTAPAAQPIETPPKPNLQIVKTFTANSDKFRIKKEADGTYKLQHLDWDKSSAVNGKYTKQGWYLKAKFTSFTEVAKDANGVYFKIKDFDTGKTRYVNQYGNDLSKKQLQRLGLAKSNGMGGRSM